MLAFAACLTPQLARADCPAVPLGSTNDMVVSFLAANGVQAASSSLLPSSVKKGMLVYDGTANALKYCDGTNWVALFGGGETDPQVGTLTASKWCVANAGGTAIDCTADAPTGIVTGAAGSASEVQFRNSSTGAFAADANLFWNNTTKRLSVLSDNANTSVLEIGNSTATAANITFYSGYGGGSPKLASLGIDSGGNIVLRNSTSGSMFLDAYNGLYIRDASGGFATRVYMSAAGNLGIGTTTPQSMLQVAGGVQLGDDAATCPGASNVKLGTLRFNAGALNVCLAGGWTGLAAGGGSASNGTAGYVQFSGGSGAFASDSAASNQFFWDATNHRLGLGIASPTERLHLYNNTAVRMKLDIGVTNQDGSVVFAQQGTDKPICRTSARHSVRRAKTRWSFTPSLAWIRLS
jgi:hypothetical protein